VGGKKGISIPLRTRLSNLVNVPFARISYSQAIKVLQESSRTFEYPVSWGSDLAAEHEKFLTDEVHMGAVVVYNYPKDVKPFYMHQNEDGETVAAMDVLLPTMGEIAGGSQREGRLQVLEEIMEERRMDKEKYQWYTELREYGTVMHSGFGVGFERLVAFVTGMHNVKDVVLSPRYTGHAES